MDLLGDMVWYVPVLIFFARICDVSIGTVRMILVISGHRWYSTFLGFFEVLIWVLAVGGVITNLTSPVALVAYAGGFATGVMVGMFIEEKIALGYRIVRAISTDMSINLSGKLRERNHRVTRVDGHGKDGPVEIAFMITRRRDLKKLTADIAEIDPKAYLSIGQADRPTGVTMSNDPRLFRRFVGKAMSLRK